MKLNRLAPCQVRTVAEVCSLQRDNFSTDDSWILLNVEAGTVTICEQRAGENSNGSVTISRSDFRRLANWYFRPQSRVRRKHP